MKKKQEFIKVLSVVVSEMLKDNGSMEDIQKKVAENLIKKGYEVEEIDGILAEIFTILDVNKNKKGILPERIEKQIKMRLIHPSEIMNLTDKARNYFFKLRDSEIIDEDEFELVINEIELSPYVISVQELNEILEVNGIEINIKIN